MLDSTSTESGALSAQTPVREGVLTLPGTLRLHYGGALENVQIAWRLVGTRGPVVAALGGISSGRYVTGSEPKGWWREVVAPGGALDTERFRILGLDFLGGSGQTTGPTRGQGDFPSISSYDQVSVLNAVLDHLNIPRLKAIVGASYGAMVALAFGERHPDRVEHIVAISGADRTHPMSTAWRSVQRAIVRHAVAKGDGPEGLRLARALAMATYRSSQEFAVRFNGEPTQRGNRFEFPVEQYLLSRGDAYAASYIPEAFVCLSESIDLHRVDPKKIRVPVTLVAIREDQIVPLADMQALKASLAGPAELVELSSLYGHDAFLKEVDALAKVFASVLDEDAA
jgi:homoserine O-acetyltransferase